MAATQKHNEDTRVKIPYILHLTRLGYSYLSLKDQSWELETNIFPELTKLRDWLLPMLMNGQVKIK